MIERRDAHWNQLPDAPTFKHPPYRVNPGLAIDILPKIREASARSDRQAPGAMLSV